MHLIPTYPGQSCISCSFIFNWVTVLSPHQPNQSSLYYAPLDLKIYRLIKQPHLDRSTNLHLSVPTSDKETRLSDGPLSRRLTLVKFTPSTHLMHALLGRCRLKKTLINCFLVLEWQDKNVSNCHSFQAKNTQKVWFLCFSSYDRFSSSGDIVIETDLNLPPFCTKWKNPDFNKAARKSIVVWWDKAATRRAWPRRACQSRVCLFYTMLTNSP